MNPIKWTSPYPVGQVQPRQVVSMRGGVVNPNMQPMYTALQQKANNQFTAMRDQKAFNNQIARDNLNHIRRRASVDYEYEKRKKLAEETEQKIKEQKQEDWEREGKLKHQLTELKFKQTLLTELGNVDKKEHANKLKQNLQTTIDEKKKRLDEVKKETAQRWLEENIDDEWDAMTPSEKFGEQDFDWVHVADDGDITIGGKTFTDKMDNDVLRDKYESLTGPEKMEFAKQLAKRKGKSFDEAMMVSQEQKDLEEQIQQMEEVSMTIMETNPNDIRMMRQQLLSVLNPDLETKLRSDLMDPGSSPNFDPRIDEGMGRDATHQRSLDFSRNESAKTNSTNPVMPPKNTDYKTKEIKETNWVPDPEVLSDSMDF